MPGTNYTPVQGIATFLPNQLTATFTVPVLAGNKVSGSSTVGLVLSNPAGGALIGSQGSATLTITTFGTNPVNPSGPVDTIPPQITGQQLIVGAGGITAVVFSFSKPLNAARAQDLGNYGYYVTSAGSNGGFGTSGSGYVSLAGTQYNPAAMTVTVVPVSPLPYDGFYRIVIDALANSLLNRGIADLAGNLLSGQSNGVPGSPFVSTFGAGPQLNYTDSLGKSVNLSLTGGGVMEVFRAATGDVQRVTLVGTVPRKSVLSLHANKAGGTYTFLPPIQGAAGVRLRYRTPPIVFRSSPVLPSSLTHKTKPVRVKRVR
jgi:hypothetical protein